MSKQFYGLLFCLLALPLQLSAHSLNDSFLGLTVTDDTLSGTLQIAITDLEIAIGIDSNSDTRITWGELRQAQPAINDYLRQRVLVSQGAEACTLLPGNMAITQLSGGSYAEIGLQGQCARAGGLTISYGLLFDVDNSHRGIAVVNNDGSAATHVFAPDKQQLTLQPGQSLLWSTLASFVWEGIWHIWIGIDHILFLLAMLCGVVLFNYHEGHHHNTRPASRPYWQQTGLDIVKMITAFTVAHSLTLILASMRIVELPAQWVETAIAFSVVISGINILLPLFGRYHWPVAFGFGLIHGFGFANVLGELNLDTGQFITSLLGFNLGVELGQLAIVLVLIPVLALLIHWQWSRRLTAVVAALAIVQVGMVWFLSRGFGVNII